MKKLLSFCFIVLAISANSFAQTPAPTVATTPTATHHKKGKKAALDVATPSPSPTATPAPKWIPAPPPKEESRTLTYSVNSLYRTSAMGSELFGYGDIYARRKLDEYSVTADLLVRFSKSLSSSDTAQDVDLRLARLTYIEPFFQISAGRFDLFPILTPMTFFGAYPDMGLHRVDGAMIVIPVFFRFGIENYQTYTAPPTAITLFYSPSLLEGQNVILDTSQAYLLTQARFKTSIVGIESSFRANFAWTSTPYFKYSALNGGMAYSFAADFTYDKDLSFFGEWGEQNAALFTDTGVIGIGARYSRIGTWGPFSIDSITLEGQFPLGNSINNEFTGGNPVNNSQGSTPVMTWYGDLKTRIKNINLTFTVTNNLDDYTLNRLTPTNTNLTFTGDYGPGRETDRTGTPLRAASSNNPAFLISAGVDF